MSNDANAQKLVLLAMEAIRQQKYDQALLILSNLRDSKALLPQRLHLLGIAQHHKGQFKSAARSLHDALRAGDTSPLLIPNLLSAASAAGISDDSIFADCAASIRRLSAPSVVGLLERLLKSARYGQESSLEWNDTVHRNLILPVLLYLIENDQLDAALLLERYIYINHVKQQETEDHFRRCFEGWTGPMHAAGMKHAIKERSPGAATEPVRTAFFIHTASTLAHVQFVIGTLKGLAKSGDHSISPSVYCFSGNNEGMLREFSSIGVPVILLDDEYPDTAGKDFARLARLADRLAEDRIDVLVWVSVVLMMPLAFGMRMAPVQIWWSMKYHSIDCPGIDHYMTRIGLSTKRHFAGRLWDNVPARFDDWPTEQACRDAASPVREQFPGKVILGSLGREEKLKDPAFLASISRILHENPDSVFLYTGRTDHPAIREAFLANGVKDRTRHVGWVDTRVYANALDIFLDSFPFPCGITACQAMSTGAPIIMRDTPEARETGVAGYIVPIVEGNEGSRDEQSAVRRIFGGAGTPHLYCANSDDEYVSMASRLIHDPAARKEAGAACRAFIEEFMTGTEKMGEIFRDHILNAVNTARSAKHPPAQRESIEQ